MIGNYDLDKKSGAKIKTSLQLVPLQNAAPHGQSKQKLLNLSENF